MKKIITVLAVVTIFMQSCGGGSGTTDTAKKPTTPVVVTPEFQVENEHLSGGAAATTDNTSDAFSDRSVNMTDTTRIAKFEIGDDFFQNPWVAGSASTSSRDGLGGLFNNNACQDCHIRDGRGHAPDANSDDFNSILFRTARRQIDTAQQNAMLNASMANVADTSVGGQIQHLAVANVTPEVDLSVTYEPVVVTFEDGHQVTLRKPLWHFTALQQATAGDFNDDTLFSARVAPPMIGLGLLSLVSQEAILAKQDINDSDNNGISGKANYVWSLEHQDVRLGRFGWKAGQPSLLEQSAGAFVNDMGLTNRLHQAESCLSHQVDCANSQNGNGDSVNDYPYEVSDVILDAIGFYSTHLSVPQRRNAYADDVQRGKAIFMNAGCQQCHTEQYTTDYSAEQPELSEQVIFPYTDLLLHDMGSALADFTLDNQPGSATDLYEYQATATEWRTPPLWGLGRAKTVDPQATFLHDGRATTIIEAVLWHGGEAEAAKNEVLKLTATERADLLSFLNDL
ncbi:MAG: di-heme oxidoredictase family protein [Thalassotalea sp.]